MARTILTDLPKSKAQLIENAFLRQQLIILNRQVKKPQCTSVDRFWLALLVSQIQNWKNILLILQPDTLLRWHRQGFRLFWKFKTRRQGGRPKLSTATSNLIQQLVKDNWLWGAERIRGELRKLDLHVATSTIRKYMRQARHSSSPSQTWSTFLNNHAPDIWACDFLPVITWWFRSLYLFFIVELGSRRVVHFNVTAHPTDAWVVQQLREATPLGQAPRFLIRDRDRKYGKAFTQVATCSSIKVLKTPYRAPKANAVYERFLGSVRRECLDHMLIIGERHLYRVTEEYVEYFDHARPHQGLTQRIPGDSLSPPGDSRKQKSWCGPVLHGTHHDYQLAA